MCFRTLTRSGAEVHVIVSDHLAHKLVIGITLVYLLIFVEDASISMTLVRYICFSGGFISGMDKQFYRHAVAIKTLG